MSYNFYLSVMRNSLMSWKRPWFTVVIINTGFVLLRLPLHNIICPRSSPTTNHTKMLIDLSHLILIPKLSIETVLRIHYRTYILSNMHSTLYHRTSKKTHTRIRQFRLSNINRQQVRIMVLVILFKRVLMLFGLLIHFNYNRKIVTHGRILLLGCQEPWRYHHPHSFCSCRRFDWLHHFP